MSFSAPAKCQLFFRILRGSTTGLVASRWLLVFAVVFSWAPSLWGQSFTGNITGVVTDPNNAVIAGAQVVLTNTATGEVRNVASNEVGRYTFPQVSPATYNMKVTVSGFKEYQRTGILLSVNQTLEVNVSLVIGELAEVVEVSAEAPVLDTQTANQSVTLDSRAVQELPVNARNPFVLAHATAGVVAIRTGVSTATQDQNHNRFSMNGGRDETVLVLIDGVPASAGDWSGLIATPGVDSVSEVQIVRNTYEAQFGKTGGGVVNLTSKGGSQQFHGTLFEYHRNDNLDANSFFNNRFGRSKSELKRNQFGGNLGGPIWRSKKLYGFFGYEGLRQGSPNSRITTVPTALERVGDFSQTLNANGTPAIIYDPLTTRPDPNRPGRFIRDPFLGNRIPTDRMDTVGLNVLKLLPLPNQPGEGSAKINNFVNSSTIQTNNDRYDIRIDWARSQTHTLFGRFTKSPQTSLRPSLYNGNDDAETDWQDYNPRWHLSVGNTFMLSPTMVVNVLLGGGNWTEKQISKGLGYDFTTLGLSSTIARQFDANTPFRFNIADYATLGVTRHLVAARNIRNGQINVSKELGAHSLKAGWSLEYSQLNFIDANSGTFSFDRYFTFGPDPDLRTATAGNSIASLLLGTGASGNSPIAVRPATTQAYWAWYAQDAWKVNQRLTVNYGLRYEIQKGRTERYDRLNWFDFDVVNPIGQQAGLPNLKGGLRFLGDEKYQWHAPRTNFAPRMGIAYKVTDKLVARAGYGIFYLGTVNVGPTVGTTGFSLTTPWVSTLDGGRTPNTYLRNPYPNGLSQPTGAALGLLTGVGLDVSSFQQERPTPYMQQYSLDLQYQLTNSALLEFGYVGNQGRKLSYGYDGGLNINQIPDSALSLGAALREQVPNPFFGSVASGPLASRTIERRQLLRPYPQFLTVNIPDMPGASSSYNAFVAKLNKRFSGGLTLIASYQFSKAIDNASENQGWEIGDRYRNANNLSLERSISGHDMPHSMAVAYIYELPVGKNRKLGSNMHPVADAVLGGWQVSGITKMDSGLPLRFQAPQNDFSYSLWQYPNVTDVKAAKLENRTIDRWFNTSAFSLPADYSFGNAPRFFPNIRFGRTNNWDLSLAKNFVIKERLRGQFRAEFFNAFNRVQFGRANTNISSPGFGQVTGTAPGAGPRNIQFGLRFAF